MNTLFILHIYDNQSGKFEVLDAAFFKDRKDLLKAVKTSAYDKFSKVLHDALYDPMSSTIQEVKNSEGLSEYLILNKTKLIYKICGNEIKFVNASVVKYRGYTAQVIQTSKYAYIMDDFIVDKIPIGMYSNNPDAFLYNEFNLYNRIDSLIRCKQAIDNVKERK